MSPSDSPTPSMPDRLFLGRYERGVDRKGRITLPAGMREALGDEEAIITKGLDPCLVLVPRSTFDVWRQKVNALPMGQRSARDLRRHLFSSAARVSPDGMGRINIPSHLLAYAGLDGAAMVIGMDSHVEIWNAERFAEVDRRIADNAIDQEAWDMLDF